MWQSFLEFCLVTSEDSIRKKERQNVDKTIACHAYASSHGQPWNVLRTMTVLLSWRIKCGCFSWLYSLLSSDGSKIQVQNRAECDFKLVVKRTQQQQRCDIVFCGAKCKCKQRAEMLQDKTVATAHASVSCSCMTAASLPPDASKNLSSAPMKQTLVTWPLHNFCWWRSGYTQNRNETMLTSWLSCVNVSYRSEWSSFTNSTCCNWSVDSRIDETRRGLNSLWTCGGADIFV